MNIKKITTNKFDILLFTFIYFLEFICTITVRLKRTGDASDNLEFVDLSRIIRPDSENMYLMIASLTTKTVKDEISEFILNLLKCLTDRSTSSTEYLR